MNRKTLTIGVSALLTLLMLGLQTGCGIRHASGGQLTTRFVEAAGPSERQEYTPGSFSAIEIRGNGNINLRQGSPGVTIEGARNQIELVSVTVESNTLIIEPTENVSFYPEIDINISLSQLTRFQSVGIFNLNTVGSPLEASNVVLDIKGSGNYRFLLDGRRIGVQHNGFGKVELVGMADTLEANVNATGSFDSRNLLVNNAVVEVNGVGNAHVYASQKLVARANGVGSITYRGSPIEVDKKIRGIGRIAATQ